MSSDTTVERVQTHIWQEIPEPDNPFSTHQARCHGFDVYGEMLGQARWVDMFYLLFRGEPPSPNQARLLETLAVALMNPGPRDPAVHAAMCAGVGGSPAASALMAALAVGAGQYTGAREVRQAVERWLTCGTRLEDWRNALATAKPDPQGIWPHTEHAAGFDPYASRASLVTCQTLDVLARCSPGIALPWLAQQRSVLEDCAGGALAMSGVAAAALTDLEFTPEQAEMVHLMLRLPGAAAHALEQRALGYKNFPFFALDLLDDPMAPSA
jgi:citrate synthase